MAEIAKLMGRTMAERKAHQIRIEKCKATKATKARFGLKTASGHIVGEKLQNFAEASLHHRDSARELPQSISEARQMFTPGQTFGRLFFAVFVRVACYVVSHS